MTRILAAVALLLLLALGWSMWRMEAHKGTATAATDRAETAEGEAKQLRDTLADEREEAQGMTRIGDDHEDDRAAAQDLPAAVVAGIDDGTLKLRRQWAACETNRLSESAAGAFERDALAQLRKQDQGDLVRVGRDADDQLRACQAVIRRYESAFLTTRDGAAR
ncbi:hypothetical protein [Luteimonas terricola]|uniref:Lysozyme n=1 Tax=Luteimonas terricola TaxID=645597 RepID=A0ABQ2EE39_9GAMM|nr:hypothetical protein [Luteimonas terricola]GGK08701.1 hypothetical protein GCM10011394_17600 [Luteimonas terricola]